MTRILSLLLRLIRRCITIGTKSIEDLISICLWTAYLDDEQPQSLLILCEVEGGKSILASQFADNNGIVFPHDITAHGIITEYKDDLIAGKIKHIILPEFVFPLSRQRETVNTLLALLNGLMEEGIREIRTFATSVRFPHPVKVGVIACLSKDEFTWRKNYWSSVGFLSRFLPVSYSHSAKIEDLVFEAIYKQEKEYKDILWSFRKGHVALPSELMRQFKPYAKKVASDCSKDKATKKLAGYRAQTSYQRMTKALALARGKHEVEQDDVDRLIELSEYIILDYNEL